MAKLFLIGDIQGCADQLIRLIKKLPSQSKMICLGDLVNRGPDSLGVLRKLKKLQEQGRAECILGNHDLNLLAVEAGIRQTKALDTVDAILKAPDRKELIDWLRHRPLALSNGKVLLVHAGVLPQWNLKKTLVLAKEVERALRKKNYQSFLSQMYGNAPSAWHDSLRGFDRLRVITNALTRLRFCRPNGEMEFTSKEGIKSGPPGYMPWFSIEKRKTKRIPIVFGHWSTLGLLNQDNVVGIDTGCVWGGTLTALDLNALEKNQIKTIQVAGYDHPMRM
jgi:bis(5'-nucleosyl)-tetraphosphatase (symmetrical)